MTGVAVCVVFVFLLLVQLMWLELCPVGHFSFRIPHSAFRVASQKQLLCSTVPFLYGDFVWLVQVS